MRGWVKLLCALCAFLCASCAAIAEDDEIYYMGPEDAYYHVEPDCTAAKGSMYLVTMEAAQEFSMAPCSQCALGLSISAERIGAALVIRARCRDDAVLSVDGANCSREINGAYYFVLADYYSETMYIRVESAGKTYYVNVPLTVEDYGHDPVVSISRDTDEFMAYDAMGMRLCKYSDYSNTEVLDAEVCLDAQQVELPGKFDEFTGEYIREYETEYALRIPVSGYTDRGIMHYWLLTRDEYSRMDSVVIIGGAGRISGDVCFKPFYTGDETVSAMGGTQPWEISADGTVQAESYENAEKIVKQDDYCGHYLNSSGTYTVVVKNPTKKRAREYAKMLDGDIWVIQGEYTWAELTDARQNAEDLVNDCLAESGIDPAMNRVVLDLYGAEAVKFADAELFSPCVNAYYAGEIIWERGEMAAKNESVAYAPISSVDIEDTNLRVSMGRSEYPLGCGYISFNVELPSGYCALEMGGGLEKYVDGKWRTVVGDYAHAGYDCLADAFAASRTVITRGTWSFMIPTEKYETLGTGLYRIKACRTGDEYAVLEFTITDDATPLEEYAQIRPRNAKAAPSAHLPVHSTPGYSSLDDDFNAISAGGWEFRLVWLSEDVWEHNRPKLSAVVAWPGTDSQAVQRIFEMETDIFRMFDAGNGIILMGANEFYRISYDGSEFETLFTTKKGIKQALMVGEDLYYMTDAHLWVYKNGTSEKLWSPKKGTGDMLEYYNDTLYAANAAGKTVTITGNNN